VHGLTREDLAAKPKFGDVAREFLDYVKGAELIIHNADFDIEFLDMELDRLGLPPMEKHVAKITDTLLQAKELHPGKKNSLDALCERYFVDNSRRTLHGALADARLLAECYLAMTRGQESLMMDLEAPAAAGGAAGIILDVSKLIVQRPSADELALHEQYLDAMEKEAKAPSLWRKLATS
jgi:DNA polymerase-3 subunit epsilon